jgi:hypothetical protein
MTAVEWLIQELRGTDDKGDFIFQGVINSELIEQAKEMEKQQMIDCGNTCAIKQHIHIEKVNKMTMDEMLEFANTQTLTVGEEYYNETFKK